MYQHFFKPLLDFILALLGIVLLSPFMLIIAVIIKLKLGGSVLFTQQRPGKHGKVFKLYKFRSMSNDKDSQGNLLPDEQRLTPFGKALRATSLDELPSLVNVLKGNMSLVGPRPLLVDYLPLYNQTQARRHDVRPGITGLAQVNGRNLLSWQDKFAMDVFYVDHVCLKLDAQILWKTVAKVFQREGINNQNGDIMEDFTGND